MSVLVVSVEPMSAIPDVIARYYAAAAAGDLPSVLECFAIDAHVLDEGHDYYGVEEIRGWREGLASRFTYTTEITAAEESDDGRYVVRTHLEGNFPGGVVDLEQRFTLTGGLISDLSI